MFVGNVLSSFVLFSLKILEVPHQPRCTHPKCANNVQDSILTPMALFKTQKNVGICMKAAVELFVSRQVELFVSRQVT